MYVKKTKEMREAIIQKYREVGKDEVLEKNGWRQFPKATMPEDPDAYLLFQDMGDFTPDKLYLTDTNTKRYFEPRWW